MGIYAALALAGAQALPVISRYLALRASSSSTCTHQFKPSGRTDEGDKGRQSRVRRGSRCLLVASDMRSWFSQNPFERVLTCVLSHTCEDSVDLSTLSAFIVRILSPTCRESMHSQRLESPLLRARMSHPHRTLHHLTWMA